MHHSTMFVTVFKQLHQKGVGTETKEMPVLTKDDEDELWKKVLDLDSPKGLQSK